MSDGVGFLPDQGRSEVLQRGSVGRKHGKRDHFRPGALRILVPSDHLDRLHAVLLEDVRDRLSEEVGVVVWNPVFVAVHRDIHVPSHGQVVDVGQGIERAAGIEDACFVGHA